MTTRGPKTRPLFGPPCSKALATENRGEVLEIGDRRLAIRKAVELAHPGDVVVVAGKGHETGQEIAGVIHPFSDVETLTAAIREAHR